MVLLHVVYDLVVQSLLAADLSGCENQLLGDCCSHNSCQSLCSSCTWNQAPVCFWQSQQSSLCGNSDVSVQSQLQTSTQCGTVNNRNHRAVNVSNLVENSPQVGNDQLNVFRGLVESLLEISTCAEMTRLTALQDDSSEFMVLVDFLDSGIKFSQKINREGVFLFGVVKLKFSDVGVFIRVV